MDNKTTSDLIETINQKEEGFMTKREQRIEEYKRRYPLRSNKAYKRHLPRKIYWLGNVVVCMQLLITAGMAIEKSWKFLFIPMSGVCVFLCVLILKDFEDEGAVYDNWRGIVYMYVSVFLFLQLFISFKN